MNKFTDLDLVKFLYGEGSPKKLAAISGALETDWNLRDSFEQIASGQKILEEVHLSPREEVVNKILQYIPKTVGQLFPH